MCKAFSCIVDRAGRVAWKFGTDSHTDILEMICTFPWLSECKDTRSDASQLTFARVEISPKNGNYLFPDEWDLHVDQAITPTWFGALHRQKAREAHEKWMKKLDKIVVRKQIIHPFKIGPPKQITKQHINVLRKWASVRASVWNSVWDSVGASVWASVRASVGASVGASVWASVWDSVRASVRASVGASVGASVWAYTGSFFILPLWKYVKHPRGKYPFAPCVKLWEQGLVPSFDGKTWRLHGGPKAAVLFEISAEELKKRRGRVEREG